MQRATHAMTTEEHERWMRRTIDRVILLIIVVVFAAGALVVWHNNDVHAKQSAQRTVDCIMAGRDADC